MGFAYPRRAEQGDVVAVLDEAAAGKLGDLLSVNRGLVGKVEGLQGFDERKAGKGRSHGHVLGALGSDLLGKHLLEEVRVGKLLGGGLLKQGFQPLAALEQPQPAHVRRKALNRPVVPSVRLYREGDRQLPENRLDPILLAMNGDERHRFLPGSPAWAKNTEALRRISFAPLSSRFSRGSSPRRSRSVLVTPARRPCSRSACRTHLRRVSAGHTIFAAIDSIAAHCEACSAPCSKTSRTARSRTSGKYLLFEFMTPCSQETEPPGMPGRFRSSVMPRWMTCWSRARNARSRTPAVGNRIRRERHHQH